MDAEKISRREQLKARADQLVKEGKTRREVAAIFIAEGIPTLSGKGVWSSGTVYALTNYQGYAVVEKTDNTIEPWMFEPLPWTPPEDQFAKVVKGELVQKGRKRKNG